MMNPTELLALLEHDCRAVVLESVTSTNDEVVQLAAQGGAAEGVRCPEQSAATSGTPLVVVSAEQTAGRGRLGRTWASPPGGVYLSVLFEQGSNRIPEDSLASLSPLAALSLRVALQQFHTDEVRIKWPNDLLSAHGKLVGILVEVKRGIRAPSASSAESEPQLVVGVGINVNRPSAGAFEGAGYLNDGCTCELSREAVAAAAINSLLAHHIQWRAGGCSLKPFVAEYRDHLVLLGKQVCVRDAMGTEVASGKAIGVDERGSLLLTGPRGTRAVAAGEVTLRDV